MTNTTIYRTAAIGMADDIKKYVDDNAEKMFNNDALILPNRIVLLITNGQVQMWDNHRRQTMEYYGDAESAYEQILSAICLWYVDDLAQMVYEKKVFICPDGRWYRLPKFNFPLDEDGFPEMTEDEMLMKFRSYTKQTSLWTAAEMKKSLGITWDVRRGC